MGLEDQFAKRLENLFADARRLTVEDARRYRAEMAAKGMLNSGPCMVGVIGIVENRAGAAVKEALVAIDNANTLRAGSQRRMRSEARRRIVHFMVSDAPPIIKENLDRPSAENAAIRKRLSAVEDRLTDLIEQHATGLDRPRQPWMTRHPQIAHGVSWTFSLIAIAISIWSALHKR